LIEWRIDHHSALLAAHLMRLSDLIFPEVEVISEAAFGIVGLLIDMWALGDAAHLAACLVVIV